MLIPVFSGRERTCADSSKCHQAIRLLERPETITLSTTFNRNAHTVCPPLASHLNLMFLHSTLKICRWAF